MNGLSHNLKLILNNLPEECTLVAVSKTKPEQDIIEIYNEGHRDFGENKVQELSAKSEVLPKDIRWHMIGHLQRNKVKFIASFVHLIHGVDSLKLLKEINKQGKRVGRIVPCLLQIHIAEEETKFGFSEEELNELISGSEIASLENVQIKGLMGMATLTDNQEQVSMEFRQLRNLFDNYREKPLSANISFEILSMGMSGDYELAIENGSNMVRIGSSIFGARN